MENHTEESPIRQQNKLSVIFIWFLSDYFELKINSSQAADLLELSSYRSSAVTPQPYRVYGRNTTVDLIYFMLTYIHLLVEPSTKDWQN